MKADIEKPTTEETTSPSPVDSSALLADATVDALTNMIDYNIRKGACATYDDWQAEVVRVLNGVANATGESPKREVKDE